MHQGKRERSKKTQLFDILSRHYLALGLRKHPDIGKYIADVDDLDDTPMLALLKLAAKLGVADVDALIDATEREQDACRRYSDDYPAFIGRIKFDLTVEVFGKRIIRKARADYTYTPEWPYYDLQKRAIYEGWPGSSIQVEFLSVPDEDNQPPGSAPEWREIDILAIDDVWNTVEDAIEAKCKVEDEERRRVAAQSAASPARRTRARH
jgi:hypothetical protein